MKNTLSEQIQKLDTNEKLVLVEEIWDSIISEPHRVPLTQHQKSILDERLKTLDEDTKKGVSWDEFRKNYL
jgi:putative addiction module component (TIGR02574 family)